VCDIVKCPFDVDRQGTTISDVLVVTEEKTPDRGYRPEL